MKKVIYSVVVIFAISLSTQVFAGIRVDPVTLEVVVPKGGEKEGVIKVGNTSEKPMRVTVSPEKFGGTELDIGTWLTFEPMEQIIKGFEEKEIKYRLKLPEDSVGELRCMVFLVADEVSEVPSSVGIRFGVPVYAIAGGTEVIEAVVDSINVEYNLESEVLSGTILVNNKGNIHIRPFVNIEVFDDKGNSKSKFSIPYGEPAQIGQLRPFMYQQKVTLELGKYKIAVSVDYGKMYGLNDKIATGEKEFVVEKPKEKAEVETGVSENEK